MPRACDIVRRADRLLHGIRGPASLLRLCVLFTRRGHQRASHIRGRRGHGDRGERQQHAGTHRRTEQPHASRRRRAIARGIKDGAHPAFELA